MTQGLFKVGTQAHAPRRAQKLPTAPRNRRLHWPRCEHQSLPLVQWEGVASGFSNFDVMGYFCSSLVNMLYCGSCRIERRWMCSCGAWINWMNGSWVGLTRTANEDQPLPVSPLALCHNLCFLSSEFVGELRFRVWNDVYNYKSWINLSLLSFNNEINVNRPRLKVLLKKNAFLNTESNLCSLL